eukprot:425928-Rhodomonas_salina.1
MSPYTYPGSARYTVISPFAYPGRAHCTDAVSPYAYPGSKSCTDVGYGPSDAEGRRSLLLALSSSASEPALRRFFRNIDPLTAEVLSQLSSNRRRIRSPAQNHGLDGVDGRVGARGCAGGGGAGEARGSQCSTLGPKPYISKRFAVLDPRP